jgi:erythronate-4-phosphate dehydrogenase
MRIVADKDIPYVTEAFADIGAVTLVNGRGLSRAEIVDADILLVRSVTQVTSGLIAGTKLRFIASATSGIEHIDVSYLKTHGIGFAYAPGSNARSVAQYVVAAMISFAGRKKLRERTLGIIGVGNVGSLVHLYAESLGMRCVLNDPPKFRETNDVRYRPVGEVLEDSDIVTLHVPLEKQGRDPTFHLVNDYFLKQMRPGAVLINTSRGRVVDEAGLKNIRDKPGGLIIDVWDNEPRFDTELCGMADIATPHIAGYSYDGKVQGTLMIHRAACLFFKIKPQWDPEVLLSEPAGLIETAGVADPVAHAVLKAYPLMRDDEAMRVIAVKNIDKRGQKFDALRAHYPKRLEFAHYPVRCSNLQVSDAVVIKKLGFSTLQ